VTVCVGRVLGTVGGVSVGGDHELADARVGGAGAAPHAASLQAPDQQVPQARHSSRNGHGQLTVSVQPAPSPAEPIQPGLIQPGPVQATVLAAPEQRQAPLEPEVTAEPDVTALAGAGRDDIGFRDYVATRSRALLRTAYLLTGNVADAEDLVQAALAKTYLAWDRIEDRGALDGYVRRAIVNTHISWWRRRRVEEYPTDEIPDQAVADHAGTSDLQESMRRAVDRLPQRMRAAVVLRYYEDMTEAEVADVLGVSLGTVKSTVSRAVAKLRDDADLRLWP
jgi:RNA polymerase sigma-70 factor (sigma-E family)